MGRSVIEGDASYHVGDATESCRALEPYILPFKGTHFPEGESALVIGLKMDAGNTFVQQLRYHTRFIRI